MNYYWNQLLYALGLKKIPTATPVEIINSALEVINGGKSVSEIEERRGINALNAMIKEWGIKWNTNTKHMVKDGQ